MIESKPKITLCVVAILSYFVIAATKPAIGKNPVVGKSYELHDLKMNFVRIEAGEFLMGSPGNETSRGDDEFQHRVKITKPFYMLATEVSQREYEAVMGENPSYFKGGDLPVENLSWPEAAAFCGELSRREGHTFRLPSEAEWEYAARAGKSGPVAGTGKLEEMAWYADVSGTSRLDSAKLWDTDPNSYFVKLSDNGCRPRNVGTGKTNDWSLHDMQGNVCEWVADWYVKDFYRDPAAGVDPTGPEKSDLGSRVIRGGSWGSDPRNCRVAKRDYNVPRTVSASCGFRVVMEGD